MSQDASMPITEIKRTRKRCTAVDEYLRPSPAQLRQLWDFDNVCAKKYMGAPLRTCSSVEPPDAPGETRVLSQERMTLIMADIKHMWQSLNHVWEIFTDQEKPSLGYRLRVRKDLPISLQMKTTDCVTVGWKAVIPVGCVSQHLYERSDIAEGFQYLGGPISYSNWCPKQQETIAVRQVSHGSSRHQVRAETKKALKSGTELMWNYLGSGEDVQFDEANWFKSDCCSIAANSEKPLKKDVKEVFEELCVLCGKTYRSDTKESVDRRPQKKVHFINSHVNFLGSDWDGSSEFLCQQYAIDYNRALLEAERLNRLLQRLHSNAWKVVPACTVMTKQELSGDSVTIMTSFRKHCARLKRVGCLVLRGRTVPTMVEDLKPVIPSGWKELFPDPATKPKRTYAMAEADRVACEKQLQDWMVQDVMMIMNIHHYGGDTSDDPDED